MSTEPSIVSARRPLPGAAHSGYFIAPQSVGRIFSAAILNDPQRCPTSKAPLNPVTPAIRRAAEGAVAFRNLGFALIGWFAVIAALAAKYQSEAWFTGVNFLLGGVIFLLALRYVYLAYRDQKYPLDLSGLIRKKTLEKGKLNK